MARIKQELDLAGNLTSDGDNVAQKLAKRLSDAQRDLSDANMVAMRRRTEFGIARQDVFLIIADLQWLHIELFQESDLARRGHVTNDALRVGSGL